MTNLEGSVRLSDFPQILNTRKERASGESISNALLLQAGYIHQASAGVYEFGELGLRTLRRIEKVVREEMKKLGSEIKLTTLQTRELWEKTERWEKYGSGVFRTRTIDNADMLLAPTHEEPIVAYVATFLQSYRQLPFSIFQITDKFRNEKRPRFGLLRGREFLMKDSYSFDHDEKGMVNSFEAHRKAYRAIFSRLGLTKSYEVQADSGTIGGTGSIEFLVAAENVGEDVLMLCSSDCGYGANLETAVSGINFKEDVGVPTEVKKIYTPSVRTIDDLAKFLTGENKRYSDTSRMIKTLIYFADGKPAIALVAGNYEVNEVKLRNALGVNNIELADEEIINQVTGAEVGFAGPYKLRKDYTVIADPSVMIMRDALTGANETDYHYIGVDAKRDFTPTVVKDIRNVVDGEPCRECGSLLKSIKGTEIGHIFQLGTAYSEPLGLVYTDETGKNQRVWMGCYGIGVSRLLPVILEQKEYHDLSDNFYGMTWPAHLAPFDISVIPAGTDEELTSVAKKLYKMLDEAGLDVMLDDRPERFGVKIKDSDLIGAPLKVIVGKRSIQSGKYELETRMGDKLSVPQDALPGLLPEMGKKPWDQRVVYLINNLSSSYQQH